MFSRHDINSPKEVCSLTDSPSWNLTDNDFLFAEAGAPWGVEVEEMHRGLLVFLFFVFFSTPHPHLFPLKINWMTRGTRYFIVVKPNYYIFFLP